MTSDKDWQAIAAGKRESNAAKIPKEWRLPQDILKDVHNSSDLNVLDIPRSCGILTDQEVAITEKHDATALLEKLASGELTAYDVTLAFCKRAALAQQLTNCLTEIMFEEALARAKSLDEQLKEKGKPMGPLHGLPISLKDSFNVKGVQATVGYVSFVSHPPASQNSALVDILLSQGAVLHCKTNLPQTMMTADSENNVFGRTLNPNKLSLTAGGSTGGEGALLKMRGSLLGVGTDIAGSVRIPPHCNGVWGFKPTVGRIPFSGKTPPGRMGSPSSILPCIGPQGHSVRDMELFMKTVLDFDPWQLDEGCLAVPWRRVEPVSKPLRLGLIMEDPKRPLHPSIMRAMTTATEALKDAGHTIIPLDGQYPSIYETAILAWKFFLLDPAKTPLKYMKEGNEPFVASLATSRFPELDNYEPNLNDLFDMNVERRKIMKVYHDLVVQNQLDAIVMPTYQATAVPHDTYGLPIYTVLPNVIDYPAAAMPYLKASKELDKDFVRSDIEYVPPYDADAVEGAPCGIQVVGKPMRDEELMTVLKVIEDVLKPTT
ncbi:hypothetical protein H2201_003948 [Coniosporium apollinis]|uniref:Amidase domain-containing protein n=1 Tax=Coniosporium apollinis TaxID=61459 RepID=A0ABQ9NUH1_9PEZI|nr:hypothetical protein H2201_003948 [Coniosporium apollinis]